MRNTFPKVGILAIALLMVPSLAGAIGGNIGVRSQAGPAQLEDHSAEWDAVDLQIDLTGLWGSINPVLDRDPFALTRSDGTLYLVWAKWNGARREIAYSFRPSGAGWSGVQIVHPGTTTQSRIRPWGTFDEYERVQIVWTQLGYSGGVAYHSLNIGGGWTAPKRVSGTDDVQRAEIFMGPSTSMVTYWTVFEIVTVEVTIIVSSGGSDDADPGTVTVETNEVGSIIRPLP